MDLRDFRYAENLFKEYENPKGKYFEGNGYTDVHMPPFLDKEIVRAYYTPRLVSKWA